MASPSQPHPTPGVSASRPPDAPPALSPDDQARVAYYRAQFHAQGMTDAEIATMAEPTDATTEEVIAWLEGRGPCPWPH